MLPVQSCRLSLSGLEAVTDTHTHGSLHASTGLDATTVDRISFGTLVAVIHETGIQIGALGDLIVGHGDEGFGASHTQITVLDLVCRAQVPQCR